jgi:hypothetical protein
MVTERSIRGWSQVQAVAAMRTHSDKPLPDDASLVRQWRRWEKGECKPDRFYAPLVAATFGTVTHALFPEPARRDGASEVLAVSGMETLEIIGRLQASDISPATLDALRVTVDRLCSEYPYVPAEQLLIDGRAWLRRLTNLQAHRLTLGQHKEVLVLAGLIALLLGCVEYDLADRRAAETTRRAALSLGTETGDSGTVGWAYEISAWMALTSGDYRGAIAASRAGTDAAGAQGVAVQLAAQEAKAWARLGDRRQSETALDRGRRLLESLPPPTNLDHHFVVDPSKFDFYAMDCYRTLREDRFAESLAEEVIRAGTNFDGSERSPMRIAEAKVTLGVVAARHGELSQAIDYGRQAVSGPRKSLPHLRMSTLEMATTIRRHYGEEAEAQSFLEELRELSQDG